MITKLRSIAAALRAFLQRRDKELALLFCTMWLASTGLLFLAQERTNHNTTRLSHQEVQIGRGVDRLGEAVRRQQALERIAVAAQVSACKRLNVQRALVNRESYANWKLWNQILGLIVHPIAATPAETAAGHAARVQFLQNNRAILRSLQWVPLTDCRRSVTAAGFPTYGPRNFSFKHPPPRRALHPTDGEA